jgi:hypothetical protein
VLVVTRLPATDDRGPERPRYGVDREQCGSSPVLSGTRGKYRAARRRDQDRLQRMPVQLAAQLSLKLLRGRPELPGWALFSPGIGVRIRRRFGDGGAIAAAGRWPASINLQSERRGSVCVHRSRTVSVAVLAQPRTHSVLTVNGLGT